MIVTNYIEKYTISSFEHEELYDRNYNNIGGCLVRHRFEWRITLMKQYRQQVCNKCGMTGKTEKYK